MNGLSIQLKTPGRDHQKTQYKKGETGLMVWYGKQKKIGQINMLGTWEQKGYNQRSSKIIKNSL